MSGCNMRDILYSFSGEVIGGNRIGRGMGIPTVNIPVNTETDCEFGVYAATVNVYAADGSMAEYYGVANIGVKPTIKNPDGSNRDNPVGVEVNLFDFAGDLYGCRVEVLFHRFIRKEQRFADITALKEQISRDIAATKEYFNEDINGFTN